MMPNNYLSLDDFFYAAQNINLTTVFIPKYLQVNTHEYDDKNLSKILFNHCIFLWNKQINPSSFLNN